MKTKLLKSIIGVALFAVPFVLSAQTTTYYVSPEIVSGEVYNNDGIVSDIADVPTNNPYLTGNDVGGIQSLKVGASASTGAGFTSSAIIPFKLPTRPSGKLVVSASLRIHVNYGREWITSNVDLYGLPFNAVSTIYSSDHYDDVYPDPTATVTGIEDDYFAKNVAAGNLDTPRFEDTSVSGNTALVTYLNAQYDAGAVAGDYVFLRLNVDDPATTAAHYFGIDDGSTVNAPTLTIEIEDAAATTPDVTITAPTEDGYVSDPAIVTVNNPYLWGFMKLGNSDVAGDANTTSAIIPFQLPARPVGESVDFAKLNVYVSYGREWIQSNVDLYGLTFQVATANGGTGRTIFATDHYSGVYPDATAGVTAIENIYFNKNVPAGSLDTPRWEETTADAALIAYLNAQYDAGAVAGDWVFLRLSVDAPSGAGNYFKIEGGDTTLTDANGDLTPANLQIGFSGTLSVSNIEINALNMYPNPVTNGKLNISLDGFNEEATLQIYSILGKLVQSEVIKTNSRASYEVDINLAPGLYIVKLTNGEASKSQKLIVQ